MLATAMSATPLLAGSEAPVAPRNSSAGGSSASAALARRRLRRAAVDVLSAARAERMHDPGRPNLTMAAAYMRYFLPKTADGQLLGRRPTFLGTDAFQTADGGDGESGEEGPIAETMVDHHGEAVAIVSLPSKRRKVEKCWDGYQFTPHT